MFGSFPPSPLVGLRLQSLLGPGSRHCYGIITPTTRSWCNRLIYKRGCQEHFSPSARCRGFDLRSIKGDVKNIFLPPPGAAVLICDIQPLSPRRRSGVVALNDCISAAGIFFSSDDADQFRNKSSRVVVRCQPWIYLRLLA